METLPLPRLRLTWRKPNRRELKKTSTLGTPPDWMCDYELLLPLQEGDIRRSKAKPHLAVSLGGTRVSTSSPVQIHTPYRDGAHAAWDSAALGNIPIYIMGSDGIQRVHTPKRIEAA